MGSMLSGKTTAAADWRHMMVKRVPQASITLSRSVHAELTKMRRFGMPSTMPIFCVRSSQQPYCTAPNCWKITF